ncbi:transposase family protein, partial [Streptococcus chenjunshii]
MEHLKYTTELIGMKDPNIIIGSAVKYDSHIVINAMLDYLPKHCPLCNHHMIKYDFQKPSTIPILDIQGMPTLLKLKKRRFQ